VAKLAATRKRAIAVALAQAGHLNARGKRFGLKSVAVMLTT
jgi:hypothetical protein